MSGVDDPRDHPMTAFEERVGRLAVRWMTGANLAVYRLSGGRVAGRVPGGSPICLLTTTGRRTGRPRTVPLLALPQDAGRLVVVASHGGMSTHPAWYLNVLADPGVTVETGSTRRSMVARTATTEERSRLWPALSTAYPHFDTYQRRTTRRIPVVILDRAPGPALPPPG